MRIEELVEIQNKNAAINLHELFMSCWRRFRDAARLVELSGPGTRQLEDFGYSPVNLSPLMPMYKILCNRYATLSFTGQEPIFPTLADTPDVQWTRYYHFALVPRLVENDELVRNVLRVMTVISCKDIDQVSETLAKQAMEMVLPTEVPTWTADRKA
jgi:hypothetical protein